MTTATTTDLVRIGAKLYAVNPEVIDLDDVIHQPLRLRIMAALGALPAVSGLEFAV